MDPVLLAQREGRVLRLTLNRPDKRNALNHELCSWLVESIESAEQDPSIGAILVQAEGQVFCAGMDLEEAGQQDAAEKTAIHQKLFSLAARVRKPIVAAVQGPALGGGVGLVANAHIVIAAQGVSFGLTEIRIGMWPFVIFASLRRALGERRSIELSLAGRIFSVNEALHWGLVHELTQPLELKDRAYAVAAQIANSSSTALFHGLDYVHRSRDIPPEQAIALAAEVRRVVFESDDFREGIKAFQEKRPPVWPSHRT